MTELKPCPFCGQNVEVASFRCEPVLSAKSTGEKRVYINQVVWMRVECRCGAIIEHNADDLIYLNGEPFQIGEDALKKWNRRAGE